MQEIYLEPWHDMDTESLRLKEHINKWIFQNRLQII